jgi:hypothetical protein
LGSTQLQRQAHALLQPSHALGIQPLTPAPAKQQGICSAPPFARRSRAGRFYENTKHMVRLEVASVAGLPSLYQDSFPL